MKKFLALALAAGSSAGLFAQTAGNGVAEVGESGLIAGFDFGNVYFEGIMYDGEFNPIGSVIGTYSDTAASDQRTYSNAADYFARGTLYFDGSKGSSAWGVDDVTVDGSIGGYNAGANSINRTINTIERTTLGSIHFGANLETSNPFLPGGGNLNGVELNASDTINRISFAVDTTNFADISLSLAGMTSGSGGVQWYYSVDGGSTVSMITGASTNFTSTFTAYTYDFSGLAAIEGSSEALFIAEFSGLGNSMIDNVQVLGTVTASAIPEPSTYAAIAGALALGGVILRRRYAKA